METFYSVLGVGPDADRETIVRAYRDEAKSHHPDVSDSPDATEQFKRLTTAKEVLADETKRAEYDRLGHESYVARHDRCGWPCDAGSETAGEASDSAASSERSGSAAEAAQAYADGGDRTADATPRENPTRSASGGAATSYYRPGQRVDPSGVGTGGSGVLSRFQAVGPWLLLDGILLVSALATAWVIVSWGSLSALSIFLAVVLCVAALAATSLHLSVRAYA